VAPRGPDGALLALRLSEGLGVAAGRGRLTWHLRLCPERWKLRRPVPPELAYLNLSAAEAKGLTGPRRTAGARKLRSSAYPERRCGLAQSAHWNLNCLAR